MSGSKFINHYIDDGKILKTCEEYEKTKEIQLFRYFSNELGASKNTIKIFDDWVENIMPEQIKSQSFETEDMKIDFEMAGDLQKPPYIPQFCRDNNIPYTSTLRIKYSLREKSNNWELVEKVTECGEIPILVGSKRCHLYGKSPEETIRLGECISDPFGYFIITSQNKNSALKSGREVSLITQEKSRMEMPIIIMKDNRPYCSYTSAGMTGTKIMYLNMGKKWNTIKIRMPELLAKDKSMPLFLAFYFLMPDKDINYYLNIILRYIPKKYRRRSKIFLNDSIIKYKTIIDKNSYMIKKKPKQKNTINGLSNVHSTNQNKDDLTLIIQKDIANELFMNIDDLEHKVNQLGVVAAKYILTIINVIPFEIRDAWSLKRFEGPGRSMSDLFMSLFEKLILTSRQDAIKRNMPFINKLTDPKKSIIRDEFISSFNDEIWSIKGYSYMGKSKGGWSKDNVSNSTERLTPLSLYSQLDKNNTPSSRLSRSSDIREVQPSQRNRHCPSETPEGKNVGLNKYQSLLCMFSIGETKERIEELKNKILELSKQNYYVSQNDEDNMKIIINGKIMLNEGEPLKLNLRFVDALKKMRRKLEISRFTEIYYDSIFKSIEIYNDHSRPTCPYFIVDDDKNLVIDNKDMWDSDIETLLKNGCVEFIASREEENDDFLLCTTLDEFRRLSRAGEINDLKDYSHVNINPSQMFSTSTSVIPFVNRQPGPRCTYQASMGKQALGSFSLNHHLKFYTTYHTLFRNTRAFTETDTYFLPKMDIMPSGQTINVAFATDNDNQEDAVVICEDAVNSGLLNFYKYFTVVVGMSNDEEFYRPDNSKKFSTVNEDGDFKGLPDINTYINEGDCIVGKRKKNSGENTSIFADLFQSGYVDRIYVMKQKNITTIKFKFRKFSKYKEGDKEAFRYSQKGTVGRVEKRENMMVVTDGPNKGMVPDLVFNPHGFPSRQTMGILLEGLITKAALYDGKRVNVSAYKDVDIEGARKVLENNGMDPDGYENMAYEDEIGDKSLHKKIFFVPLYTQALKHHVSDKISIRSNDSNNKSIYTHQPVGGRTQGGGQKIGEMEKDAFIAHGSSGVTLDRMLYSSDEFRMVVCHNCGNILAKTQVTKEYFCPVCKEKGSPGLLTVSYVFKLLLNLLMGMGISTKLKTIKID